MDVGQLLQAAANLQALGSGVAAVPSIAPNFNLAAVPAVSSANHVLATALSSIAAPMPTAINPSLAAVAQPAVNPALGALMGQITAPIGLIPGAADPTAALLLASAAQQKLAEQQNALETLQRLQSLQTLQAPVLQAPALQQQLLGVPQTGQSGVALLPQGHQGAMALAEAAMSGSGSLDLPSVATAHAPSNMVAPTAVPDSMGSVSAVAALDLLGRLRQGQDVAAITAHLPPPPPPSLPPPPQVGVIPTPVVVPPTVPSAPTPLVVPPNTNAPPPPVIPENVPQQTPTTEETPAAKAKAAAKARVEAETQKRKEEEAMKCHLHKKPKDACKFCKRYQEYVKAQAEAAAESTRETTLRGGAATSNDDDKRKPIEIANTKTFGFSTLMQTHIIESTYYKSTLSLESVDQIIDEAKEYAKSVEPYMQESSSMPSPFICLVYRLFTLGLDGHQMFQLLDSFESPYIRCLGFVNLRFGLHTDRLWGWLGEYVLDDEEFQLNHGSGKMTTIGEFVEDLMNLDKYYGAVLPRISGQTRRQLDEKLAPVAQYRKRTWANREVLDLYRTKGTRVEVCIDGTWVEAVVVDLLEDFHSRLKVLVRLPAADNADEREESIHLGKVILRDPAPAGFVPERLERRGRSRSRSRDRTQWSWHKGKSDQQMVSDLRQEARERAVCSSGKEYAKRPTTFDKGLAKPREAQGVNAKRLLEEETVVKVSAAKRHRSPSPSELQPKQKEESAEHKERMRKLFEKYGNAKSSETKAQGLNEIETTDVLRLG